MIDDSNMDQFLRESLIEEADRMEKELNSDPALQGVGASEDMFEGIKMRLQKMGVWEEEESGQPDANQNTENAKENLVEREAGSQEPLPGEVGSIRLSLNAGEIVGSPSDVKRSKETICEEKGAIGQGSEDFGRDFRQESAGEVSREKTAGGDPEGEESSRSETEEEKLVGPGTEEVGSERYRFLSEEDREALELGKRIKEKRQKRGRRRRRMAVAAAAFAVLVGVGMSGEASRNWILDALDRIGAAAGLRIPMNYQGEQENIAAKEEEEREAWTRVKEEIGVSAVEMDYKPERMLFDSCEFSEDAGEIVMFYTYQDKFFTVQVEYGEKKYSKVYVSDVEPFLQETVKTNYQDIEVEIWNTTDEGVESYFATFRYGDAEYFFIGRISLEEMREMMKNIFLY